MAEPLTPNPKQSLGSTASRIQPPRSPFFLGSNDDKFEREQARASRAAASRRKSVAFACAPPPPPPVKDPDPCLDEHHILELLQNCIKLASENKINQKNTWELNLIDHLCEVIKVEENNSETNFQKASCTLEAGVKIYSLRVDSVHSEAYKVLGGINRAGQDDSEDTIVGADGSSVDNESNPKKQTEKKISPLSTLEPSFEALNVKRFDVAFAVDPLYHQTSAQFDEGRAKGLLLNNLGVYGGCQVLFDSQEIPGKLVSSANQPDKSEPIDLSFAREYVQQMVLNMRMKDEISPSLWTIINQFDDEAFSCGQKLSEPVDVSQNKTSYAADDEAYENFEFYSFDHEDQPSIAEENLDFNDAEPTHSNYHEEVKPSSFQEPDLGERFENVDEYLFLSLGLSSKQNSWAGPDHWKFRKTKGPEDHAASENGSPEPAKKPRRKKQAEPELDFTKALDEERSDIFVPPIDPKSLLLPENRAPCQTKLPEDCHYQPENLVKLFLLPNVMCLGRRRRKFSGETRQQYDDYEPVESLDNENAFDASFDDPFGYGNDQSDLEDANSLVSRPRQVNKIEVQYDKTSKQVDVQVLKDTLWDCIQESPGLHIRYEDQEQQQKTRSFKQLLGSFPSECKAARSTRDISPHLCFICLLHLANENGLILHGTGTPNLDDLSINLPP
ncbi:PREDICTED: condensin complex subunit 2-like isoform X2 [Tarenaya hassleriana]|uniref:condensin complex subunit 2-like isoform X2 n=1 Tax=Tarenaya hassleriana TaxID=28532 RepID=UPI00053C4CBA|nr:PREDICTED: condensin complex subunit 2-like isoform X2 [Tarenaya hassleriana]